MPQKVQLLQPIPEKKFEGQDAQPDAPPTEYVPLGHVAQVGAEGPTGIFGNVGPAVDGNLVGKTVGEVVGIRVEGAIVDDAGGATGGGVIGAAVGGTTGVAVGAIVDGRGVGRCVGVFVGIPRPLQYIPELQKVQPVTPPGENQPPEVQLLQRLFVVSQ
jgi:hypothetical protein